MSINTDKIFKENELDKGFILRANEQVTKVLKEMIQKNTQEENQQRNLEIVSLDPNKKTYGLVIDNKLFLATLVDLPCLVEAQKTLDFRTFYKSVDVAQMLYVHNKTIDEVNMKMPEEILKVANEFNPIAEDPEFLQSLYRRNETSKRVEEMIKNKEELKLDNLKFRHGLATVTKNIRNIRYKKEPNVDPEEVHAVETILKDIIDYGFADNVEEELLEFDEKGNLVKCIKGAKEKKQEQSNSLIKLMNFGPQSIKSDSNYQNPYYAMDQSSYSQSMPPDPDDDGTSIHQDTVYNDPGNDYNVSEYNQSTTQQNFQVLQFPPAQQDQQQFQQISNQPSSMQGDSFFQMPVQQEQSFNSAIQIQTQSQISQEPRYTRDDLRRMKQDLKEIKRLIKQTQGDIEKLKEQGADVSELQQYYRVITNQKSQVKQQKKLAKKQLKEQQ